jgi:hypothetical protein
VSAGSPPSTPLPIWARALGAVTILIALAWGHYGYVWYKEVGSLTFMKQMGDLSAVMMRAEQANKRQSARGGGLIPFSAETRADAQQAVQEDLSRTRRQALFTEGARYIWGFVTAGLIGVMIGAGISMLAGNAWRGWTRAAARGCCTLVFMGALVAFGMAMGSRFNPPTLDAEWQLLSGETQLLIIGKKLAATLLSLPQARYDWLPYLIVAIATTGFAGARALRYNRALRGMGVAIASGIMGALATLGGLSVLMDLGGMPPLQNPMYYVYIALAQSGWSFVLLIALFYVQRSPSRPREA